MILNHADSKALADVASIIDKESGLPAPGGRWIGGKWVPIDTPVGSPGWTMRVRDVDHDTGAYEIDDEIVVRIEAAVKVPEKDRTKDEAVLAVMSDAVAKAEPEPEPQPKPEIDLDAVFYDKG